MGFGVWGLGVRSAVCCSVFFSSGVGGSGRWAVCLGVWGLGYRMPYTAGLHLIKGNYKKAARGSASEVATKQI